MELLKTTSTGIYKVEKIVNFKNQKLDVSSFYLQVIFANSETNICVLISRRLAIQLSQSEEIEIEETTNAIIKKFINR